ncbi:Acyl-CoA thioester hydrolase ybgC precursor [Escherichia coli]|uniref:Acyl-CoA thioester hydrolase ybgC n=1 Tax=Escherichia coli TaxID=562 RepID=A0A377F775_ECOLX|nr:Acyl-CoA thioester hydrolase ybgC precursor [Escherichia coli]
MIAPSTKVLTRLNRGADAVISNRPFAGNTGSVDDNDEIQRNLNDTNYNRMWEYNNRGVGSKVVAEAKK